MAKLRLNTQVEDLFNQEPSEDHDSETSEEEMPRPWRSDLLHCEPKIITSTFHSAPVEDQEALETLRRGSENLSVKLRRTVLQRQVQKILQQVEFCILYDGSEEYWLYFVIQPILELALELSGLEDTVLAVPLQSVTVSPPNLVTRWKETTVSRGVDLGLVVQLDDNDDDVFQRIPNLTNEEQEEGGIGPALDDPTLERVPLFCHIVAKRQYQVIDPIVQLGIWTSAVYTRWGQIKSRHGSSRDLPISFGWTIEGSMWHLHVIRQLPDGSRHITRDRKKYDTQNDSDMYLLIAMLHRLIAYGYQEFREQFLDSVLSIRAQYPAGSGAPHMRLWNRWHSVLLIIVVVMVLFFEVGDE